MLPAKLWNLASNCELATDLNIFPIYFQQAVGVEPGENDQSYASLGSLYNEYICWLLVFHLS